MSYDDRPWLKFYDEGVKPDFELPDATYADMLEEGLEEFNMDIPVVGLTEMIAEHLVEKE